MDIEKVILITYLVISLWVLTSPFREKIETTNVPPCD